MDRIALLDLASKTKVTLNGKPATIAGRRNNFMVVAALDGSANFEWSDKAIHNILTTKNGTFKA